MIDALTRHRPGEVRAVTSVSNDAVKAIRALELRKNREETGLFVAEGARTLIEAIETGHTPRVVAHLALDTVRDRYDYILEVDATALAKISHRDNPQTVIGVLDRRWTR